MVAISRPQRLIVPLPLAGAAAGGGVVALVFLVMPAGLLEGVVSASGIPAVLAAAEPPLGFTARVALALVFGGLVAGFAWFGLGFIAGQRTVDAGQIAAWFRKRKGSEAAAPRPPLYANRDLGTPFLDVRAPVHLEPEERDVPVDLDQPLAAFDPGAMLAVPLSAPEPLAPLARPEPARPQLIDPGDRFETFELTPMQRMPTPSPPARPEPRPEPRAQHLSLRVPPRTSLRATGLRDTDIDIAAEPVPPPAPTRVVAPETESTVHALLARLERGVAVRPAEPEAPTIRAGSLEDALGDLRRLATGTR